MKQTILILLVFLPIVLTSQQSKGVVSFYSQAGFKSSAYIIEAGHRQIVSATEIKHHKCIILNVGFQWELSEKWRLGPSFTYDHFGTKHRSVEFSNLSYLIRLDRVWKRNNQCSIFSGIALGLKKVKRFEEEKVISRFTTLGCQIIVAGINYKLVSDIFIDVSVGWGVAGILSFGAKYQFK